MLITPLGIPRLGGLGHDQRAQGRQDAGFNTMVFP